MFIFWVPKKDTTCSFERGKWKYASVALKHPASFVQRGNDAFHSKRITFHRIQDDMLMFWTAQGTPQQVVSDALYGFWDSRHKRQLVNWRSSRKGQIFTHRSGFKFLKSIWLFKQSCKTLKSISHTLLRWSEISRIMVCNNLGKRCRNMLSFLSGSISLTAREGCQAITHCSISFLRLSFRPKICRPVLHDPITYQRKNSTRLLILVGFFSTVPSNYHLAVAEGW